MPQIDDGVKGQHLRHKSIDHNCEWLACPSCGKERWVDTTTLKRKTYSGLCRICSCRKRFSGQKLYLRGENNPAWRGGRTLLKTGYIRIPIYPEDPLMPMATHDWINGKYHITEHRYVMAKHLGRCLHPWEVVHHKNGDKTDNRLENLELLPNKEESRQTHMAFILLQQENKGLRERIANLEARVTLLEAELSLTNLQKVGSE